MLLDSNTTIIITGASDGIGRAIAIRLAKEGVNLALIGRDASRLQSVENETKQGGVNRCRSYICDLRDSAAIQNTISIIEQDFSQIHILINNAGIWQKLSQLDVIDKDTIDEIIETNFSGVIHMTRYTLPYLRKADQAIILNVISKSGVAIQEEQSIYTATKYGIFGFTEVLKKDLKESNIRVAGVYQSGTNTDMFRKTGENFDTNRFTEPADLAETITYMMKSPSKMWIHDIRIEY